MSWQQAKAWTRRLALTVLVLGVGSTGASALGQPEPWQMGFQEAVTPVMHDLTAFHNLLLFIIISIALLVLGLMAYVCVRFNAKKNPTPSKATHNTLLEIIWTGIPVLILVIIAVPSFKLLYKQDVVGEADMTIKAIGRQWYWSYEYPDHGNFTFDAFMLEEDELEEGQPRLLATDNEIVVPVNKRVRLLTTASDVIHSWAIPAFGVKLDAVPGKLNESWFQVERTGVYYGQCSELCGVNHGFMPIAVRVVEEAEFEAWVKAAQEEFAAVDDSSDVQLADAQ